jgi:hypothetical protein
LGSLSEPRRKQNLYANPKRTAKSHSSLISDALRQKKFKLISTIFHRPQPSKNMLSIHRLVTSKKRKNSIFDKGFITDSKMSKSVRIRGHFA